MPEEVNQPTGWVYAADRQPTTDDVVYGDSRDGWLYIQDKDGECGLAALRSVLFRGEAIFAWRRLPEPCPPRQSEWSFLDWDDASLMRAACHEKGCRNYAEDGYRYCITHLHGTPDAMPEQMWKRKLFLEKGDNHD